MGLDDFFFVPRASLVDHARCEGLRGVGDSAADPQHGLLPEAVFHRDPQARDGEPKV